MPLIDMPLDDLRAYAGRNPRPDDFDQYWERALAELAAQPDQLEWTPRESPPNAEWLDLWFTGVGGARIHARVLRPKGQTQPGPAVLEFHGYQWMAPDFAEMMRWVAAGFTVFALDVRGQGGLSQDIGGVTGPTDDGHITRGLPGGADNLLFRQIFLDCAQLARIALADPMVDPTRVHCIGGSQGGALALVCAALEPRIARCVSVFPYLCDYKRVYEMDLATRAYEDIRTYLRRYLPTHEDVEGFWRTLGYIDVQFLASRIRAEVLAGCGLMDTVCPPSTQFAAYNKLTCPHEVAIYPDFGHEGLRGFNDRAYRFLTRE
ncbi:MAG: acetylxylan esterase [Chthonomonas sp.]|nr:acetylxylan esterase [Chthonomonas sp.]